MLKTSLNVGGSSDGTGAGNDGDSGVAAANGASNSTRPAYEELFNSFAEAVYILDEHGRFLDVNDAAVAMYGHPREFFLGKTYETITAAGRNDLSAMATLFQRALAGEPQSLECWGMRANGGQFPQDLRLTPTSCAGQAAVIAVARDVTRQKQAEMQVHRLNRLYAVLNATNEFIVRCHDAHTLFNEACRIAVEVGGFRMTWIGLTDPVSATITPVAHSGQTGDYLEHLHIGTTNGARGNGPTGEALRKGQFNVCNDIANDPRMAPWRERALRMGYSASAAFPLLVAGELRGALSLYSDTAGFFDTEEISLLERLSQNISFALEVIDIESRRLANEETIRIKERALSTSINGIAMADLDGTLSYVNQAFLDLWGFQSEAEVLGQSVLEFWKSPEQASELIKQLFVHGFIRGDLIGKRKDGSCFVTQLSANLVTDQNGKPVCMQGAFIDISERTAAEELMQWDREQQATLRGLLEVVLNGGTLEETLEYCLKQLLTVSWLSILPKGGIFLMDENRQTLRLTVSHDLSKEIMSLCNRVSLGKCHCGKAAATRQVQFSHCVDERHEITYPGMVEHGHYNMPLISEGEVLGVMVLYLPHGFKREPLKEQFLSSVADILAGFVRRKRHEESLRLSAAVIKSTHDAVMITDLNRTILSVNPSFTEITGYTEAEALGQTPKLLYSERHDLLFYQQMWRSIEACGYWQGEIWNRRKNGELYPEWLTLSTVRDEKEEVVNYVGVFSDISMVKRVEEKLEHLAHYDALTDLPNRLLLQSRLKHAIEQARRDQRILAVLFLDLDRFKRVNDSLGHPAGDELLQTVARRLKRRLREVDTLARLGGDEFVILLESLKDVQDAANIAQALIERIKEPIYLSSGREVYVGASVGISIFPDDGTSAEQLIRNADTAMYQAKESNRGSFHLYTESMTRRVEQRLDMEARLRRALTQNEFILHYQPLISVVNSRCKGVEALVRWNDPVEGRLISPGKFIPLAEETGLILLLGDWVLRTACRQMKAWLDSGLALETLAINLSPTQFKQPDIHKRIAACLTETGLPPSCLELEITESAIMEQGSGAVAKLAELKRLGVQLAIDDFGTGYSSLAYLKDFPIDKLKIDQSFVRDIPTSPAAAEIAAIIITMAKTLKLESLAEGVELDDQLQFLKARGCDSCQGFLFSRPVPAESIPPVLKYGRKGLILEASQ
jgi:diguanylate cyclase (GGDEF)-like protein/PAS domain S-box-containing protein